MDSKFKSLRCTARGALVLVGGMLVHLALGTVFTFGKFVFSVSQLVDNDRMKVFKVLYHVHDHFLVQLFLEQ